MEDVLDFSDVLPIEIPIKNLLGKDYILRDANGEASARYQSTVAKCLHKADDGTVSIIGDMQQIEADLVAGCLFTTEGQPVPVETVRSWPSRIVSPLFNKAKEISGFNTLADIDALKKQRDNLDKLIEKSEQEKAALGNSPGSTPTGST